MREHIVEMILTIGLIGLVVCMGAVYTLAANNARATAQHIPATQQSFNFR